MIETARKSSVSTKTPRPGRAAIRFSLRTLLSVFIALCICLGFTVTRARRQERAAKAIQALHGEIVYDCSSAGNSRQSIAPPGPPWLRKLVGPHYFDEIEEIRRLSRGMGNNRNRRFAEVGPQLADLNGLRSLSLGSWDLDLDEFRMIARLRNLQKLRCTNMEISDRGAAELARAADLREIDLSNAIISPAGLKHLAKMPKLETLSLDCKYMILGTEINYTDEYKLRDEHAEAIADFPRLRNLSLYQTLITDEGVAALSQLTQLEKLELSSPLITQNALDDIIKIKNLTWLGTWCWRIDGEDLHTLQELPKLRGLGLVATPITNECLPQLARFQ